MDVRITLRGMPEYKQQLLHADLEHLKYGLRAELLDTFYKFKGDKGFWFKTLALIRRLSSAADVQLQTFEHVLNVIKDYDLLAYDVSMADPANITADIKLDETYFLLLQSSLPLIGKNFSRDSFLGMLRKSCRDYATDFTVEEMGKQSSPTSPPLS